MYLSGGFLALMLFGYIIALFSLSLSLGVHCKDKSGYGSSYVIGHGAHLFRHETGSHILSILFVIFIVLKVFRLRSFISVFGTSIFVFVLVCLFESQQLVSFIVYLPNHAELSPLLDTMQAMKSVKSWKLLPSMIWSISILSAKLLSTQHTVKCFKWAQS